MQVPTARHSRREFFRRSAAGLGVAAVPYWATCSAAAESEAKNDRPILGAIGVGGQGTSIAERAAKFGDLVAICDVDREHADAANAKIADGKAKQFGDYRKLLDRNDVEAVTIGTPDHWHTKIAIDAMRAGKDVYCEKPLTLTVDEGKRLCKVAEETKRVFQVGTQQRSQTDQFVNAIALVRDGRIGKVKRVQAAIGGCGGGGPFQPQQVPAHFDYETWLGQAPDAPYFPQRCHFSFRWFYAYSGGQMTDWGAHHVDIAHWAMGMEDSGPVSVTGVGRFPRQEPNAFEVAMQFRIVCRFPGDMELVIRDDTDNGVLIEGDKGRIFVNRGKLTGTPVDQLADHPLPEDAITKVYKGKRPGDHMRNFFDCIKDRGEPISDVHSHHRAVSTCHLANISLRLGLKAGHVIARHPNSEFSVQGRQLTWDPAKQQIVGDDEANRWLSRPQRTGYEIRT